MGSKSLVFLGLFLAIVFLISSEVAARELAEKSNADDTSTEELVDEKTNEGEVSDAKFGYGGWFGGYPSGRHHKHHVHRSYGGYGYGYGGRRHYCRYGCCGQSYYGNKCRCCSYAGEKVDADDLPQAQP